MKDFLEVIALLIVMLLFLGALGMLDGKTHCINYTVDGRVTTRCLSFQGVK